MLNGNCSKRYLAFRLQYLCISSGFNTRVPSAYDKIISFYAYIPLSLFYLLIYFTLWDALKKCKMLKIRIKHFYLEVWSLIALCSTSIYQETLRSLKERLFWSWNNIIRVGQVPFPHLRKEPYPSLCQAICWCFVMAEDGVTWESCSRATTISPAESTTTPPACVAHYSQCGTTTKCC